MMALLSTTTAISSSTPSAGFWRPFLTGAVTAVSVVYLVPRAQQALRCFRAGRQWRLKMQQQQPQPPHQQHSNNNSNKNIVDSPYLEQRMIRKAEHVLQKRTSRLVIVIERCTNDHNYSAVLRTAEALGVQHVWIIAPPKSASSSSSRKSVAVTPQEEPELESSSSPEEKEQMEEEEDLIADVKQMESDSIDIRRRHHLFAQKALEWLTLTEFEDTASCIAELQRTKHQIWVTDLSQQAKCLSLVVVQDDDDSTNNNKGNTSSTTTTISCLPSRDQKVAIVFGTEAVGCTREMLEAADERVYLPLRGFADSLNLSVAAALVVHQLFVLDPSLVGDMSEEERRALRQEWYVKLARQRLLTAGQKRHRNKLISKVRLGQELQKSHENGDFLHHDQIEKMERLLALQKELERWETDLDEQARVVVQDLVEHPPEPLSDIRRADEHRTWFGGRGTRKKNQEVWANIPATTGYDTEAGFSTSAFFRSRV